MLADKLKPKGVQYSAETWHLWAKQRFLGADDVKLPSGKIVVVPKSSAELDTAEFNDFMTAVEAWAAEHDVYLEDMKQLSHDY